jgi:hypothetical protein
MGKTVFLRLGRRLLISRKRQTVRGSVIFFLTHLLFFMGVIFTAEIALVMVGMNDIYIPIMGKLTWLVR